MSYRLFTAARLTDRELATVLAALRHWQQHLLNYPRAAAAMEHFTEERPLTATQIDRLCERLNDATAEAEDAEDAADGGENKSGITFAQIAQAREFLAQYAALDKRGQPDDPAGWLQLKFSCGRARAERLVIAAAQGVTTRELQQRARRQRSRR
jgi:hypothetical protein